MNNTRSTSKNRAIGGVLLACAAVGVVVFMSMRVLDKPRAVAVDSPARAPGAAVPHPTVIDSTRREAAPAGELDSAHVTPVTPPTVRNEIAPLVRGQVRERAAGSIANASVTLTIERGSQVEPLGTIVTDARGEFEFTSDVLARALGTESMLAVDVDVPGYQPAQMRYSLAAVSAQTGVAVEVRLSAGARLFGRIVGPDKTPVEGAVATLLVAKTVGPVITYSQLDSKPCAADGRFRFGFDSSGQYRITARANGVGTGVLSKLELEAGVEQTLPDLVLAGGPPITGRVTVGTSEPVPNLELWAIDTNYANEVDALSKAMLRSAADERDDGLTLTKTWTDGQGQFSLAGLRPGHYAIRSPDRQAVLEPRQGRYEPGTNDVTILVSSQRLIVRVLDADGSPARNAGVRVTDLSTRLDGSYEPSNTRTRGVNEHNGLAAFTIEPETPIAVQAFGPRRVSTEDIVVLAQNEWTRELTLTLDDAGRKGSVRFDVLGEDGQPLTNLIVEARSSKTRIVRDDLGTLDSDALGVVKDIPAGTYEFTIGFAPGTDRDHFYLRTQDLVVVRAEQETVVSLRARRGARVRVAVDLRGATPKGYDARANLAPEEMRDRFGSRVMLTAVNGGRSTALQFRPASGSGIVGPVLPGETLLSDTLVERGEYQITLDSGLFVPAEQLRILVTPGAPTELRLAVVTR